MTDHTEALARIDADLGRRVEAYLASSATGTPVVHALITDLLAALIPEPPADDEREAVAKTLTGLTDAEWAIATAEGTEHLAGYFDAADRVMASPEWRNRRRGPITDEAVEAAHKIISIPGHLVAPSVVRKALEAAEAAR